MVESAVAGNASRRGAMTSQERWRRKRACQEAWKHNHREAYLAQKRELSRRPEYLAKRRMMYAQKMEEQRFPVGCSGGPSDEGASPNVFRDFPIGVASEHNGRHDPSWLNVSTMAAQARTSEQAAEA